ISSPWQVCGSALHSFHHPGRFVGVLTPAHFIVLAGLWSCSLLLISSPWQKCINSQMRQQLKHNSVNYYYQLLLSTTTINYFSKLLQSTTTIPQLSATILIANNNNTT
ncbi:hypothetical protein LSAT2_024301, partial [Lamellibrachia satsuma]